MSYVTSISCGHLHHVFVNPVTAYNAYYIGLAIIDALAVLSVLTILSNLSRDKTLLNTAQILTLRTHSAPFLKQRAPLWRPYFKKDGYYSIFIESTLWS